MAGLHCHELELNYGCLPYHFDALFIVFRLFHLGVKWDSQATISEHENPKIDAG